MDDNASNPCCNLNSTRLTNIFMQMFYPAKFQYIFYCNRFDIAWNINEYLYQ